MPSEKKSTSKTLKRTPVIAFLGHVDHGKTSLLDVIRKTNLASKEHGGITQQIGAYQIDYKGQKITFIDTPGHTAFEKMRSRGVEATDIVVLVVAGDDGVKPQTKESIAHIKQAGVPFLVALNKMDLPQASADMVKSQLAENEVLVEGYGGDVVCVEVSAKEKKGIDDLLEMILLVVEMQDFKGGSSENDLKGVVIESELDSRRGPVATVLVKEGSLKVGDSVFAGNIPAKVKLMTDFKGKKIKTAGPSTPVEMLGFKKAPNVGAVVGEKPLKAVVKPVKKKIKTKKQEEEDNKEEKEEKERVKIILKADRLGSLEAIKAGLPEEVEIILADVGDINESDVLLSLSTSAQIIGFNVRVPTLVKKLAETEKIKIKSYNIIYKLLEDLEARILKIMEPTINEEVLGEAEIIAEFDIRGRHIAGCKIKKGKINKTHPVHIKRDDKIIGDAKIISFQKENIEIQEAEAGSEVGLVLKPDVDFKIKDVIISYKIL
jgi:translation initiation factor IF-2